MKKRFILFIVFSISILSFITFILIINYLDPYEYRITSVASIIFTFVLGISSFLTLILYFLKKVYFRGRVYVTNVVSSFRQGFLISLYILGMLFFKTIGASLFLTGFAFFVFMLFVELFIQNLGD